MRTRLLVDLKLKRPGCVLLQAVARGDSGTLHRHFDTEDWLVAPTDGMRMVLGTDDEWARFAALTRKGRPYRD